MSSENRNFKNNETLIELNMGHWNSLRALPPLSSSLILVAAGLASACSAGGALFTTSPQSQGEVQGVSDGVSEGSLSSQNTPEVGSPGAPDQKGAGSDVNTIDSGSASLETDSNATSDLSISIGTELHGINLTGEVSIAGEPVAGGKVAVAGTECSTTTNLFGRFAMLCDFSYSAEISALLVDTVVQKESVTFTLPAREFVKDPKNTTDDGPSPESGQAPVNRVNVPLVSILSNSSVSRSGTSIWAPGISRLVGAESAYFAADTKFQSAFSAGRYVHTSAFSSQSQQALLSNCGRLLETLQAVPKTSEVTLSYAAGLSGSVLFLANKKTSESLEVSFPVDIELSWVCGAAYDSKRSAFWSGSFGGAGYLFTIDPLSGFLNVQASLDQKGFTDIAYVETIDSLLSVDTIAGMREISSIRRMPLGTSQISNIAGPQINVGTTFSSGISDVPLSQTVPLCFRDSLVQLHDGKDLAYLHVIDNVSMSEATSGTKSGLEKRAYQRIYSVSPSGQALLLYSDWGKRPDGSFESNPTCL